MEYNVMHGCRLAPPEAPKWPLQRAEGPSKTGDKLTMGDWQRGTTADDGTHIYEEPLLRANLKFLNALNALFINQG